MTIGYSGPIGGLISVQPIVATILNALYMSETPNDLQIIGLVVGMIGALAMTIGKILLNFIRRTESSAELKSPEVKSSL